MLLSHLLHARMRLAWHYYKTHASASVFDTKSSPHCGLFPPHPTHLPTLAHLPTLVARGASKLRDNMSPTRKWRLEGDAAGGRAKYGAGK
jgi:hypothetical protein